MMKKTRLKLIQQFLITLLSALPFITTAQVIVHAQLPPGGMIQKEQLWNVSIVSSRQDILNVSIKLSLQDAVTSEELMSASTGNLLLNQGVKVLTNDAAQPVIYNYSAPEFSGTFLPLGNYIACYQVYQVQGENQIALANECIRFTIEPLSPPLLSSPVDKSKIETPYPFFSWVPPTPIDMFNSLTYDILVTEVTEGQSPAEAIEYNTPVYVNNNLVKPNESYPSSFTKLDTAKTYAWQVIARNGLSYAGKTDVWTFTVNGLTPKNSKPLDNNYLLLENDLKGTYYIADARLRIKYTSFDKGHEAPLIFAGADGNIIETVEKFILPGDNYFDINLSSRLHKGTVYTATITDINGKSQRILFSIKK